MIKSVDETQLRSNGSQIGPRETITATLADRNNVAPRGDNHRYRFANLVLSRGMA